MKHYTITVNGTPYDVVVEEGGKAAAPVATPSAPAAAPAPSAAAVAIPAEAAPATAPAPGTSGQAGANTVEAPMPGQVLDIKVQPGDAIKAGQVLVVLEAMKMENEIVAAQDGVVATVNAGKGDMVNAGNVLLTFN